MTEHGQNNPSTRRGRSPRRPFRARASLSEGTPAVADAIPDKLFFRIGEVARLCGVETSVLRFWESAFPQLRPGKGDTGQRRFRRRDVETALRIRKLLYTDGYTIAGARQLLREASPIAPRRAEPHPPVSAKTDGATRPAEQPSLDLAFPAAVPSPSAPTSQALLLLDLREQMRELHALLSGAPGQPSRRREAADAAGPHPVTPPLFDL